MILWTYFLESQERCQHAILCLLENPQNNIKAFVNGRAVPIEGLIEQLHDLVDHSGESESRPFLAKVVTEILQRSGQPTTCSCVIHLFKCILPNILYWLVLLFNSSGNVIQETIYCKLDYL